MGKSGHHANAIVFGKEGQFGSKIKILKNMRKTTLQTHYSCSAQKTAPKKHPIFDKWQLLENGQKWPPCKGYSLCKKWSVWVKN